MVLSEHDLDFSSYCGVRSAQTRARPAIKLESILIGIKAGDKVLMKELTDNTSQVLQLQTESLYDRQTQILQTEFKMLKKVTNLLDKSRLCRSGLSNVRLEGHLRPSEQFWAVLDYTS